MTESNTGLKSLGSSIMCECVKSLSRVRLFLTPWTVAYQASPSMGFSRQEYWSGLPFPSQGIFPTQGSSTIPLALISHQYSFCSWNPAHSNRVRVRISESMCSGCSPLPATMFFIQMNRKCCPDSANNHF